MPIEDKYQRVWIELETPVIVGDVLTQAQKTHPYNNVKSAEEAKALMERRAKLASNMLRRLGVEGEDRITVCEEKNGFFRYANHMSGGMFSVMNDGGVWLNLGYLGRED